VRLEPVATRKMNVPLRFYFFLAHSEPSGPAQSNLCVRPVSEKKGLIDFRF
jgi:hypothetical protein